MGKKAILALIKKPQKRVQNGLFPTENTPLWGWNEYKIGLLGAFRQIYDSESTPVYGENPGGVPLLLGVFWPFFGKILVQNALFIVARGTNFSEIPSEKYRYYTKFRQNAQNSASIGCKLTPRSLIIQISSRKCPYSINRTNPYATARQY
jgi:hypothetical protein